MRTCPQCGDLVEGRADKIFCSAACKSRHFRDNPPPAEVKPGRRVAGLGTVPQPADRGHQVEEPDDDEEFDFDAHVTQTISGFMDEQKLAREADQARRVQLLAAKLDKGYEEYARRFLEAHGQVFTETELVDFVQDLEEAFEEYREHPHIEERGHPAGVRMLIFCSMRNCLAEMLEELEGMPARTLFGGVKTRQIVLELRKKYRVQLRESLSVLPQ